MADARSPQTAPGRPSAATTVVGVIGDPVAHSLSPLLHNTAFTALGIDWVSVGFRVPAGEAAGALTGMRALGLGGLSVTMPHKGAVPALLDECTDVARRLGAVNCVMVRGTRLLGDNTDGEGFVQSLERGAQFDPRGRRCLVAGAGGAARAVISALAASGAAEVVVVNRSLSRGSAAASVAGPVGRIGTAEEAPEMDLVVNATPTGMRGSPAESAAPMVDPRRLHDAQVVADLVYHPAVTPWMAAASQAGARVVGGLGMLVHQAALQLRGWTGLDPPVDAMWEAGRTAIEQAGPDAPGR